MKMREFENYGLYAIISNWGFWADSRAFHVRRQRDPRGPREMPVARLWRCVGATAYCLYSALISPQDRSSLLIGTFENGSYSTCA